MATHHLISAEEFCTYHHTEVTFLQDLHQEGLIVLTVVDSKPCIPEDEISKIERLIHLSQDLDINIAGLASVSHLLSRVEELQRELRAAKNKLRLYED